MFQRQTHYSPVNPSIISRTRWLLAMVLVGSLTNTVLAAESGITEDTIRVGSTLPLQGDFANAGVSIKQGIEGALRGKAFRGRSFELAAANDFYHPPETETAVNQLVEQGIFVMLGSFGSPTAAVSLPLLADANVPALGFTTGAAFAEPGDILNFRASYSQEVAAATEAALQAGLKPAEICAFTQNDAYGMSGLLGVKVALEKYPETTEVVETLEQILALEGDNPDRNYLGPVGVYQRHTLAVREAYLSIKDWEQRTNTTCRFVATVGLAEVTAKFIGYARLKKEDWAFSVPSPATGTGLVEALEEFKTADKIFGTQVVPAESYDLPVIQKAQDVLKDNFDSYSLEGFLIGEFFVAVMNNLQGEITRENFLKAARSQIYDLGGLQVDLTTDNQGLDFIQLLVLEDNEFRPVRSEVELRSLFQ